MTGAELDAACRTIGWTRRELARRLGCSETAIRKWMAVDGEIPPAVARWLAHVARAMERLPAPRWRG